MIGNVLNIFMILIPNDFWHVKNKQVNIKWLQHYCLICLYFVNENSFKLSQLSRL